MKPARKHSSAVAPRPERGPRTVLAVGLSCTIAWVVVAGVALGFGTLQPQSWVLITPDETLIDFTTASGPTGP